MREPCNEVRSTHCPNINARLAGSGQHRGRAHFGRILESNLNHHASVDAGTARKMRGSSFQTLHSFQGVGGVIRCSIALLVFSSTIRRSLGQGSDIAKWCSQDMNADSQACNPSTSCQVGGKCCNSSTCDLCVCPPQSPGPHCLHGCTLVPHSLNSCCLYLLLRRRTTGGQMAPTASYREAHRPTPPTTPRPLCAGESRPSSPFR